MNPYFKTRRVQSEIPTASMADIAFLLIIFFMVTTVFTATRGIDYGLPQREQTNEIQPKESIYIHIRNTGEMTVDFRPVANLTELASYIKAKMQETGGKKPVIIRTDPDVPYGRTIAVLDVLKVLDVRNISIPTETEVEQWKDYFRD